MNMLNEQREASGILGEAPLQELFLTADSRQMRLETGDIAKRLARSG